MYFGAATAPIFTWTKTRVVTAVPAGLVADVYGVRVNVPNRDFSNSISFAVQPVITAVQPLQAQAGDKLTLTGTGFGPTADTLLVDCAPVTADAWSPTAITFTVPQLTSAVTASVVVQVNDVPSEAASFRYIGGTQPHDVWYPMATTEMATAAAIVVWTGTEMLLFASPARTGGGDGGRYDPVTDTWHPINLTGAPSYTVRGAWAGERHELIVVSIDGLAARYSPATDQWFTSASTATSGPQSSASTVWTGSEMIAWGTENPLAANQGARYNPATDAWAAMTTDGAPALRVENAAVWTGDRMLVWGGETLDAKATNTGGRYDPVANTWAPITTAAAPTARSSFSAVWTGEEMIVWGGEPLPNTGSDFNTGGRYDPAADAWQPTSITSAPQARSLHSAVWTGEDMIIWGGRVPQGVVPQSAAYGREGSTVSPYLRTGARYSPTADSWQAISTIGAPAPRAQHRAVWDGTEMIVVGGNGISPPGEATGGRYVP